MSRPNYNLLIVAHPDDETIFFGGLLQQQRDCPWTVVCVTDGNADGDGVRRKKQFEKACKILGVKKTEWWGFADVFERRLPTDDLVARLRSMPKPNSVYTHGIIGEYHHPHHQDVSYAVHRAFPKHPRVFVCAYNAFPKRRIELSKRSFEKKSKILVDVYGSETMRFLNLLPAHASEGYLKLDRDEVEAIYAFFSEGRPLDRKKLKAYSWLAEFLKTRQHQARPF